MDSYDCTYSSAANDNSSPWVHLFRDTFSEFLVAVFNRCNSFESEIVGKLEKHTKRIEKSVKMIITSVAL